MPWPEARSRAGTAALPLTPRPLSLQAACGRLLVSDLVALTELPVTDNSAMDGWAVAGSPPWRVVADLPAGRLLEHRLADGQCARIATGAVLPDGADAVLPVEQSVRDVTGVRRADSVMASATRTHIRRAGEEASRGDVLLLAGTVVTAPIIGLAAAVGHDTLLVIPPATVDAFVLGDELTESGLPSPGRARDALGPQLPAWLAAFGAAPPSITRLPDRLEDLTEALATSPANLVITTGGTSVGPRDHVHAAVAQAGGSVVVDGVHVKPGHPMLLAALPGGRWLVGLPGNPLAACAALLTLVGPLLDGLHGLASEATVTARLGTAEPGRPGDGHRLLPVRLGDDGTAVVLPSCGSAMLRGLAHASGLVVIPPPGAAAGDEVEYLPLPWQPLKRARRPAG
ncbi:MAG: molybdopterin molybdotransferase MoeA [Actinomycetota bacterium]